MRMDLPSPRLSCLGIALGPSDGPVPRYFAGRQLRLATNGWPETGVCPTTLRDLLRRTCAVARSVHCIGGRLAPAQVSRKSAGSLVVRTPQSPSVSNFYETCGPLLSGEWRILTVSPPYRGLTETALQDSIKNKSASQLAGCADKMSSKSISFTTLLLLFLHRVAGLRLDGDLNFGALF